MYLGQSVLRAMSSSVKCQIRNGGVTLWTLPCLTIKRRQRCTSTRMHAFESRKIGSTVFHRCQKWHEKERRRKNAKANFVFIKHNDIIFKPYSGWLTRDLCCKCTYYVTWRRDDFVPILYISKVNILERKYDSWLTAI